MTVGEDKDISAELERMLLTGEIKINNPVLGEDSIPLEISVSHVSEPVGYCVPFEEEIDGQKAVGTAIDVYGRFMADLGGSLGLISAQLEVKVPSEKDDLRVPKRDSFELDPRVVIHVVQDFGKIYNFTGSGRWRKLEGSFRSAAKRRNITATDRQYQYQAAVHIPFSVDRFPIVWNASRQNNLGELANLAFEIFVQQLEQFTSNRICFELANTGFPSRIEPGKYLEALGAKAVYEEELVATAMMRKWLREVGEDHGLSESQVDSWTARKYNPKVLANVEKMLEQMGPKQTLAAFGAKTWTLAAYIDGVFKREFDRWGMEE